MIQENRKSLVLRYLLRTIPLLVIILFVSLIALGKNSAVNRQATANDITLQDCATDTRTIRRNHSVTRTIAANQTQCYRIDLLKEQYMHLEVMQQGVDVVVQLLSSTGKPVGSVIDSPNGRDGPELVSEVAVADTYIIAIRSQDSPFTRDPHYVIEIRELRAASAADRIYVQAERAFRRGWLDLESGEPQKIEVATHNLEEARRLLQSFPDPKPRIWGQILNHLGYAYFRQRRNKEAEDLFVELTRYETNFPNPDLKTLALIGLGTAYAIKADTEHAEARFKEATEVKAHVSSAIRAKAWLNRGNWYLRRQDGVRAIENFERAAESYRVANNFEDAADTYTNIAIIFFNRSALALSQAYYRKALSAGATNRRVLGYASYNLGVALNEMGQYQAALEALVDAKKFYEEGRLDGPQGEAEYERALPHVLKGLGFAHASLGDDVTAQEFYRQALERSEVGEKVIYPDAAAYIHLYKGFSAYRLGQKELAKTATNRAFEIFDDLQDDRGKANALVNVGQSYYDAGDREQALALLRRAVSLQERDSFGRAYTITNIGRIMIDNGQPREALGTLKDALALRREVGDKNGEAITRYTMALAESRLGDFSKAFEHVDEARKIVEEIRTNVISSELRASYRAVVDKIYRLYVHVLMQQGRTAEALEFEDTTRARSLTESLVRANVNLMSTLDPAALQRKQSLTEEILSLAGKRQLLGREMQSSPLALELNREIDKRRAQLRTIEAEALRDPRAVALVQPTVLSTKQIKALLDPDTVLLEYSLGEEQSYLWLVTHQADQPVQSFPLPERKKIEDLGKLARELLINPRLDQNGIVRYQELSRALSSILLGKVTAEIRRKRLVISADGILQYIPFIALPEPERSDWQPLILDHEIVNIPSAAALSAIRSANTPTASKTLALIADPVYVLPKSTTSPEARASKTGEKTLRPLAFAQQEIGGIKTAFSKLRTPTGLQPFTRYDATRRNATSSTLFNFRIIHYSAHGVADDVRPEASGIYFSRYDRRGRAIPNFVGLSDIYNLKLSSDLVVLSACDTALGKEIRGEGIVGLTRGFMFAGSDAVISTLWEVNEFHTANLMSLFYNGLFDHKQPPVAALRLAQRELWRQKLPPYYWAGLSLHGEWRLKQPF